MSYGDFIKNAGIAGVAFKSLVSNSNVTPAASGKVTLVEGDCIKLTGAAGTTGTVQRVDAAGANIGSAIAVVVGTNPQIGPYSGTQQFLVSCSAGSIDVSVGDAVLGLSETTISIQPRKGVSNIQVAKLGVIGQFSDGKWLCWDFFPGAGQGTSGLCVLTGDPLAYVPGTSSVAGKYSIVSLAQSQTTVAGGLLDTAGNLVGNGANSITQAWIASNGDVYFVMVALGNFYYLYRLKAGTFTNGSDASYSNKRAVLDIGKYSGVQAENIRGFASRSFLEAKVNGASHYFYCEYNVSSGRVNGSGGAGKDQAIVYRSTDLGLTWSVFLEFNTGGTHVIDHFHGATQDPYTGWIYFLTGDNGNENAIIAYNGTAAAPAANTGLAAIGGLAGYKVLYGTELVRYVDVCFSLAGLYTMPDADQEGGDTSSIAYVGTQLPRTLDYVVSAAPLPDRRDDVPPCMAVQNATNGSHIVTFRKQTANTASYPYLELWSANVEEGSWTLTARINTVKAAEGVPSQFFIDNLNRLWVGGTEKRGIRFDSSRTSSADSTSVCITLGPRTELPFVSVAP